MILMGFERGDLSAVRSFLSDEVTNTFDEVIAQRSSQGLQIEAEFLGIREMKINDVIFDKETDMAEITVSFISELISVVKNSDGGLAVTKTENGVNPLCLGQTALLGCDVWEHSYYIDFRNKRPDYLANFLEKLVDWDYVAAQL